jgi:hypothetical protein
MFSAYFIMGSCFLHKHKNITGMLFEVVEIVEVVVAA